jgi:hypothetical protein
MHFLSLDLLNLEKILGFIRFYLFYFLGFIILGVRHHIKKMSGLYFYLEWLGKHHIRRNLAKQEAYI